MYAVFYGRGMNFMKSAVITGATGAIGIALIKKLIREKVKVLVLIHRNSERNKYIPNSPLVKMVECDLQQICDYRVPSNQQYDVFYHFAWSGGYERNNVDLQYRNIKYTLDAVRLASEFHCNTFIGAGSQAEYGLSDNKLNGMSPTFPKNAFGASKLYAGHMSRFLAQELGMRHIWTRILSVYGPYDGERTMLVSAIKKTLNGQKTSFTRCEQNWDYLYSDDAAEAMYLIGLKGIDGKIYPVGSGNSLPLKEYIDILQKVLNKEITGIGDIPYSAHQVMNLCADITELTNDTGFVPKTAFIEGIKETVRWVSTGICAKNSAGMEEK